MTLSDIKQVLETRGIVLTKSLGQNFLHDGNQLRRITDSAELNPDDKVLEIGPGLGPLTELLVQQSRQVLAIEKDARLVAFLQEKFAGAIQTSPEPRLLLLHDDALDYVKTHRAWAGWKLVANLPYSVASPILVELALADSPPERLVATLQIEVAQRLMSAADEADYGVLTLLVQCAFEPAGWFKIPAGCFFPAPDVDSACVRLVRRKEPVVPQERMRIFTRVVKLSFSQRRKMMLKLLRSEWPEEALRLGFNMAGISVTERAEKVSLEQFGILTRILAESRKNG